MKTRYRFIFQWLTFGRQVIRIFRINLCERRSGECCPSITRPAIPLLGNDRGSCHSSHGRPPPSTSHRPHSRAGGPGRLLVQVPMSIQRLCWPSAGEPGAQRGIPVHTPLQAVPTYPNHGQRGHTANKSCAQESKLFPMLSLLS